MPETTTLTFPLDGLHCGSCVARADKALAAVDGVRDVNVNLAAETATVTLDRPDATAAMTSGTPCPRASRAYRWTSGP